MSTGVEEDKSTEWRLADLVLEDGQFSASLHASMSEVDPPVLELVVDGLAIGTANLDRIDMNSFAVTADLPQEALQDGVRTVVFRIAGQVHAVASYVLRAGAALDGDVVAELSDLRAELDALKRAFMLDARDEKLRKADRHVLVAEVVDRVLKETALVPDARSSDSGVLRPPKDPTET